MKLQTQIPLQKLNNPIDYNSQILLLGSCFAQHIGNKLKHHQFQELQNPFGILFHPLALEKLIVNAVENRVYNDEDVFYHKERWHCFDAHSSLSNASKEKILQQLNEGVAKTKEKLEKATHVILTLGTAWWYKHIENNVAVANCHKVPQAAFDKQLLAVAEIETSLKRLVEAVEKANFKARILITVSPVRHLKDGFVENQQSKAHLIAAAHHVVNNTKALYFPAYEIVMDELRDYRFYDADMVHPNTLAIDYIWEKFKESCIASMAYPVMDKVNAIQNGISHKPFHPTSKEHRHFLKDLNQKIQLLKEAYPFMNFETKH